MELYLMQHGACFSTDVDPDQPLSPVGREQIARSALAVRRLGLGFDQIIASPKTRAIQTAEIVAAEVDYPARRIVVTEAAKAMSPPAETTAMLAGFAKAECVLLCGHLPNLAELASHLMSEGPKVRLVLANGGLVRLDLPEVPTRRAGLVFCLTPLQMQIIAGS